MNKETTNIILVGVGGQGIILASEVISEVGLKAGYDVRKSEVHGMAQRGGSVSSHVRIGPSVKSPLIERGAAKYMLAFEKVEGLRASDYLADGATIILNDAEIIPPNVSLGQATYPDHAEEHIRTLGFNVVMVDAHALAEKAGMAKAANVVLLASLASFLDIPQELWEEVIRGRVPSRFIDQNIEAFRLGYAAAQS